MLFQVEGGWVNMNPFNKLINIFVQLSPFIKYLLRKQRCRTEKYTLSLSVIIWSDRIMRKLDETSKYSGNSLCNSYIQIIINSSSNQNIQNNYLSMVW